VVNNVILETILDVPQIVFKIKALIALEILELTQLVLPNVEMVSEHQLNNVIMEIKLDALQVVFLI
jgi:hypothetical protein